MKDLLKTLILSFALAATLTMSYFAFQEFNLMRTEFTELKRQQIQTEMEYHATKEKVQTLLDVLGVEEMETSAYAPGDNQSGICNDGTPMSTATGTIPRKGVAAVNPYEIPYGTMIFVPGYGWARAEDTGGMIQGRMDLIDLCMDSHAEAVAWGRPTLKVLVVR